MPTQPFCHATLEPDSKLSDICPEGTDVSLEAINVRLYFVDLGGKDVAEFVSV
jgi:hypothetical protein